jgi:hypothetical protein
MSMRIGGNNIVVYKYSKLKEKNPKDSAIEKVFCGDFHIIYYNSIKLDFVSKKRS